MGNKSWWSDDAPASEPREQNWWGEDQPLEATGMEKVEAFGQGANLGALKASPVVAGGIAGARLGGMTGNPWVAGLGAISGAIIGGIASPGIEKVAGDIEAGGVRFTKPTSEMPSEVRPYGVAGETFGASVPFMGAPYAPGMVAAQPQRVPGAISSVTSPIVGRLTQSRPGGYGPAPLTKMQQYALEAPKRFLNTEVAGATGASIGGGVAESIAPGQEGVRMGAEVAGGVLQPTRLILGTGALAVNLGKKFLMRWNPAVANSEAARNIQKIVIGSGEEIGPIARNLMEPDTPGVTPTAAAKAESPALQALESELKNESRKFGLEAQKQTTESLDTLRRLVGEFEKIGTPDALRKAGEIRLNRYKMLLEARLRNAEERTKDVAAKITSDKPEARATISKASQHYVEEALKASRKEEKKLWKTVPQGVPTKADNIVKRYGEIVADMLPEEADRLDPVIRGVAKRLEAKGTTVSGEILQIRSRMLSLARDASAAGDSNNARRFGELAEAALDDLNSLGSLPGLERAREFSKALHDTFTRTFAGDTLAKAGSGKKRIPPELTMRAALGAGKEKGALRFRQMREAVEFMSKQGTGTTDDAARVSGLMDTQERTLRLAASEAVDPTTGRASVRKLANFMRNNEELLSQFPEVRKIVMKAMGSEEGLAKLEGITKQRQKRAGQTAFGKLVGSENTTAVVGKAITGANPTRDFNQIALLARRGGRETVDGLVSATMDHVFRLSERGDGISFIALEKTLSQPQKSGGKSLVDLIGGSKIMNEQQVQNLTKLVKIGARIERVAAGGLPTENVVPIPSGIFDLLARVVGAKAGAALHKAMPGGGSGASLIAASRGSQYVRDVLERIPADRVREAMMEAAKNPELMAAFLQRKTSAKEGMKVARQIHAYLLQAGLVPDSQETEQ